MTWIPNPIPKRGVSTSPYRVWYVTNATPYGLLGHAYFLTIKK